MGSNALKKAGLFSGDGITAKRAGWDFSGSTVSAFDKHIRTSVPYYDSGHDLICELSDFFIQDHSLCLEIGTSLGTLTRKLAERHEQKPHVKWIGIDCESEMISKARELSKEYSERVEFIVEDINNFQWQKSDLIVAYYTIQFIPPYLRQELINNIYQALNWGGAFIVYEKVRACDARFQDYMSQIYTEFKVRQGYSAEEILNKTSSLKSVLEPFSTQGNLDMFKRAGFVDVMSIQKWVCFEGFLCIK